jgi:hypothetical protein
LGGKRLREGTTYRCAREGCGCEIVMTHPPGSWAILPDFGCCARPMEEVLEKPKHGRTERGEPSSSVIPFPHAQGANLGSL